MTRNITVIAACVSWAVLAASAVQAGDDVAAAERCRAAESDAARIACLEAALAEYSEAAAAPQDESEAASGIGADQVEARNQTAADLEAARGLRVARYETVPYRRLLIELENGQVWLQIEGDTQRIRVDLTRNPTVDIEESGLGGYKLRLNEIGRIIRVERIR